jgi:hypothetical protein
MEEHNQMKKFALLALAALIAVPASAAGVTISGYIDIGYIAAENPQTFLGSTTTAGGRQQASGATNSTWNGNDGFTLNEVNLDLASQLTNDISAFVSVDFVNGGAAALDYAYVDFANPGPFDLNVRAGRIPSVVGIEQRVSESNQTKFINLSLVSPFTVGSQDGVAIYGSFSPVNYAIALTNHDNVNAPGGGTMGTAPIPPDNNNGVANVAGLENNNNRNLSGRIGVVPIEGLELGISGSMNKYVTPAGAAASTNVDAARNMVGVDASYIWGALTLKGEYIDVSEQVTVPALGLGDQVTANAYYFEGVYDLNSKISLGARYNRSKVEQGASSAGLQPTITDVTTVSVAGVYRVADNVQLKAEYDINQEKVLGRTVIPSPTVPNKLQNNVFALSLVGSF